MERSQAMPQIKTRSKRIGIYGGTFGPLHYGHLLCAEWVRQEFELDVVLFVTSGNGSPNKPWLKDAEARHQMVVAATAENGYFDTSRVDIDHGGSAYTLLSVEAIRQQYGEDAELFYLTSSEYLDPSYQWYLPSWEGAKELFELCSFLVFPRERAQVAQVQSWVDEIARTNKNARLQVLYVPSPELSSTLLRDLVRRGRSIRYMTPIAVQQMVAKLRLYHDDTTVAPSNWTWQHPRPVKSVGIYGGRFDPITYRNLFCAEWARQEYGIDKVVFVTSNRPPKDAGVFASAEDRHEMVVAAISDNPYFEASRLDIERKTTSYTLLTVEQLRQQYGEGVELSWFLSSEYLNPAHPEYLGSWMGAKKLFTLCRFLVFPCDGADIAEIEAWAKLLPQANVAVMKGCPSLPISSALIRERMAKGLSIWYTTPWPVQKMMEKRGLYTAQPPTRRRRIS